MGADLDLFLEDLRQERRSPHAGVQSVRHRTTLENVRQMVPLGVGQAGGASTAMALQQSVGAIFIPSPNPSVNPGSIHWESLRDLAGRLSLDAEPEGLQAQREARRWVRLGFLAKGLEALEGA